MSTALESVGKEILSFLVSHLDLVLEVKKALEKGTPKAALVLAIRAAIREGSDVVFEEELKK